VGEYAATALDGWIRQTSKSTSCLGLVEGVNVRGVWCIKIVMKTSEGRDGGGAKKKAERGQTLNVDKYFFHPSQKPLQETISPLPRSRSRAASWICQRDNKRIGAKEMYVPVRTGNGKRSSKRTPADTFTLGNPGPETRGSEGIVTQKMAIKVKRAVFSLGRVLLIFNVVIFRAVLSALELHGERAL